MLRSHRLHEGVLQGKNLVLFDPHSVLAKKHIATHEQKKFESADDLNLESEASMFLVAGSFSIGFSYQIDQC